MFTWSSSPRREAGVAIVASVGLHGVLFFLLAMLWEGREGREGSLVKEEGTSLVFLPELEVMEAPAMLKVASPEGKKPLPTPRSSPPQPERTRYARTAPSQESAPPQRSTALIGERNTRARSDGPMDAGAPLRPSLAGREESKEARSFDDQFSEKSGARKPLVSPRQVVPPRVRARGAEATPPGEVPAVPEVPSPPEDMVLPDAEVRVARQRAEEQKRMEEARQREEKARLERELAEARQEVARQREEARREAREAVAKDQARAEKSRSERDFHSQTSKTVLSGSLSTKGPASLDVKATPLGRYQQVMFREIERRWQEGNFSFRSHLVPGMVRVRFLVDRQGQVSGQRRLDMQGASQMQWGLILQALNQAEIPPMSPEVRQEIGGDRLELSITFNY